MIKRYTLYRHGRAPNMLNHGDGDYVLYADIAHLLEEKTLEQHRAEFELWMSDNGQYPRAVNKNLSGRYELAVAESAWETWKAARGVTE